MKKQVVAPKIGETIAGIKVSDVKIDILKKKLTELGVAFKETEDPGNILEVFVEWTEKHIQELKESGEEDYAECEECNAQCDPTWDYCPVCGAGYNEEAKEEPVAEDDPVAIQATTQELDSALERIKTYTGDALRAYYNMGRELSDVFRHRLYKTRVDADGMPLYQSWDAFTQAELNISGSRGRTLMLISEHFSEDQFVKHGIEKLRTIARLAPGLREEFLEKAETMSTRELVKAVSGAPKSDAPIANSIGDQVRREKEEKQKAGLKLGADAARESRAEARVRAAETAEGKAVTAVYQMGKYSIPMKQVSPASRNWMAKETLVNGVEVCYELHVLPDNSRELRITRERPAE